MSFLTNLFSRHRHAASTSSAPASINWPGQSGKEYLYTIHTIDTAFRPLPGNFIYAGRAEDGSWVPIYIAQTRDLHQRLEGHVRVSDAVQNGATHIHAHYDSAGQAARCSEEHDLVLRWRPVCNEPIEHRPGSPVAGDDGRRKSAANGPRACGVVFTLAPPTQSLKSPRCPVAAQPGSAPCLRCSSPTLFLFRPNGLPESPGTRPGLSLPQRSAGGGRL